MNRLDYLKSLKNQQDQESVDKLQLPAWKRKSHDVGELFFVKRRQWKNAGGFTTNEKKKGHPGLVTIKSKRSSGTFMLVPGTSAEPRGLMMFFCPKKEIQYTEKSFKQKKSSFVLDYWRSVSRKGPFKIGILEPSDCELLQSKMIEVQGHEYIKIAYGEE